MGLVYVLGAGVDAPLGFPLAGCLFGELGRFAKGEGQKVDRALRDKLGRLQFSFEKHAGERGEGLAERLLNDDGDLLDTLMSSLQKHLSPDSKPVRAVVAVLDRIRRLRDDNRIDEATATTLAFLAGQDPTSADDTLIRTNGLMLTYTPRSAFRRVFQEVLNEIDGLTDQEREALELVSALTTNFEELLSELISGFYTKNLANRKKYLYISWLLWAYMRNLSARAASLRDGTRSFYDCLGCLRDGDHVVTLNYTDFFPSEVRGRVVHFHGDCLTYIRFDTRELLTGDDSLGAAVLPADVASFISGLDIDVDAGRVYMPGIIPPIAMKPLICRDFLERWHKAGDVIDSAEAVVVVGYSFNPVDGHFNDLIAKSRSNPSVIVVNPSMSEMSQVACNLLKLPHDHLNAMTVHGLQVKKTGRLAIVGAKSEEITSDALTDLIDNVTRTR